MRSDRVIAAAFAAAVMACSPASAGAPVKPFVIDNDYGGNVSTYAMWYRRLRASGAPVVLRGLCISACTFVLMLPKSQVCVESTASLGFHLANTDDEADIPMTQALVRRWYPEAVRKWLVGKTLTEQPLTFMRADEVVKLDIFPACVPEAESQLTN